ncbi:MAG TPA: hypothetical protein VJQ77_05955 [Novosphingobium sp.]|nr:hypothetical protein [Novosphingobium sp.]
MKIADLRTELGLSLEAFAAEIGLQSRGRMSVIERENRCSLDVALRIEDLSGGRIDAAELSEDVRKARHGLGDTGSEDAPSPDVAMQNIDMAGERA